MTLSLGVYAVTALKHSLHSVRNHTVARSGGAHSPCSALDLAGVDLLLNGARVLAVDRTTDRDACSENLLHGALEIGGVGLGSHLLGDLGDVVELEFAVVNDVLSLLPVTWWFLEGLENEWGSSGEHCNVANSVLDHNLNENLDSFPLASSLLNVFTDLLGGHTDGGALGGESGSRSNFSTDDLHGDEVDRVWVKTGFRGHSILFLSIY